MRGERPSQVETSIAPGSGPKATALSPTGRRGSRIVGYAILSALTLTACRAPHPSSQILYYPPPPTPPRAVHLLSFRTLGEIAPHRSGGARSKRGGRSPAAVTNPLGIAFHDGKLYLCEPDEHRVHEWNLETGAARFLTGGAERSLATPVAVAVGPGGEVFIGDTGRREVVCFNQTGDFQWSFAPRERTNFRPVALTLHDARLYVVDAAHARIEVLSFADGRHLDSITLDSVDGGVLPVGVAADSGGRLYVSDMMGGRVVVLDSQHAPVATISQRGDRIGDLGQPKHLAITRDGTLFVADAEFGQVHLFNERGELLMLLAAPDDQPGQALMPTGLAVAERLPAHLACLVPPDFQAAYFLFVSNRLSANPLSLYTIGNRTSPVTPDLGPDAP